ncbi:ZIP family metal transporter [Pseudomonas soli]|uniref:ZIP family metal transporter n=1 Tax=Pseudomonas soli TaxID=1306993 RepID=UPI0004F59D0A|nr:ZIP family metal transporter [Pseudomonas soli]AIN57301.1 membrane protein [Pseudomonas soli]MDW9402429.1 ZIP family metal transporter [Pseudomonas soli]PYC43121.1 ZIP family metal transporter [Pseudomonas soli]
MPPAHTQSASSDSILSAWRHQAVQAPWLSAGLVLSLLAIGALLLASIWNAVNGDHADHLHLALLGGLSGFGATALGAVLAVILRDVSARTQDVMLGFAAGMMLAASSFSLILPGLDAARGITGNGPAAAFTVVLGMGLGVLLMLGLDRFTPHEHESTGPCGPQAERVSRVWLFVLAITLHNLPEGMAIGVSFANGDMAIGLPLTSAIAIQDIPEGLAVALALRATGLSNFKAALVAIGSGLMEPLGAVIGLGISTGFALAYPISMGLAAGAMIFVVSHEVIPETHRNGHQTAATLGLMGGFAVMMFLDTALG